MSSRSTTVPEKTATTYARDRTVENKNKSTAIAPTLPTNITTPEKRTIIYERPLPPGIVTESHKPKHKTKETVNERNTNSSSPSSSTIEPVVEHKKRGRAPTKKSTTNTVNIDPDTSTTLTSSASSSSSTRKAHSRRSVSTAPSETGTTSTSARGRSKKTKIEKLTDPSIEPPGYEDPKASLQRNTEITAYLQQLAREETARGRTWQAIALRSAAKSIDEIPRSIKNGAQANRIPGVGKGIAEHIDDFINGLDIHHFLMNSSHPKLTEEKFAEQQFHDERKNALTELTRVYGIGEVTATNLYENHHIKNLDDLKKRVDLLTPAEKIGLKYVGELEERLPRSKVVAMETVITEEAKKLDPNIIIEICGSYRRKLADVGDIDVLITHPMYVYTDIDKIDNCTGPRHILASLVSALERRHFVTDTLGLGPTKFMGIAVSTVASLPTNMMNFLSSSSPSSSVRSTVIHRRIDIRLVPYNSWPFALLYFTGSRPFNVRLRKIARTMGYTLNEYGIRPVTGKDKDGNDILGPPVPNVTNEADIFRLLETDYLPPASRIA